MAALYLNPIAPAVAAARWRNVRRKVARVNDLLARGHLLVCDEGVIPAPLVIDGTAVTCRLSETCVAVWYRHDPECDEGYYWSIDECNKELFDPIRVFAPSEEKV